MRRPALDAQRATGLAREAFGLTGELRELPSYADRNYRLRADDRAWVLKIAFGPASDLEFEVAAMRWLASDAAPATPLPRPTGDGHHVVAFTDDEGRDCVARVASYLEGLLLRDVVEPTAALWRDLGRCSGAIVQRFAGFEHPAMTRRLDWDLAHASWTAGSLGIHEGRRRDLVRDALLGFRGRVLPRAAGLPRGVIHGDLNERNVVVDADRPDRISGVFDFGDMAETWLVNELAIAATYAMILDDDPLVALRELVAGHHEARTLTALEVDCVLDLIRARLAVSVTSSALALRDEPDNEYVEVTARGAWRLLEHLAEADDPEIARGLTAAIGVESPRRRAGCDSAEIAASRRRHLGPSLGLSYDRPLHLVRGQGCYLFDSDDRAHLDCVNNVCHVGHCHPHVVAAAAEQMSVLNTNTRYLHENVVRYAERLVALLPDPLQVCFFVSSGSEANELAIRIARVATGRHDLIVVDHAYHGNTGALVDASPYKHDGAGGSGPPSWVHAIAAPDPYRGRHGDDGVAYAAAISELADSLSAAGDPPAAFLCESVLGCAGQVFPATGFLPAAFERARAAGAVCIADEVQIGFGRIGPTMWGFAREGAVPDIVTLGKPIGNGHPMAAVVTTRALADAFANGMEFFSTFGGNPVSAAIGIAVLDVLESEALPEHAAAVGARLIARFRAELGDDPRVGDIRGEGLFVGVELVTDPTTREPDAPLAHSVVEFARARRVLISADGPAHNVLKIKPPLVFDDPDAEILVDVIASALRAVAVA